jgi:hypothetical protein
MTNRREFLQAGIAASVLPMAVAGSSLAPAQRESGTSFYKVIFDERFPASVAYAREMERDGAPLHAIRGDITDLWYHDLDARWKQSPVTIAGLTAHGPLFCLERLAWDHGMRVLSRVEQGSRDHDGEALISWVIGPKERT